MELSVPDPTGSNEGFMVLDCAGAEADRHFCGSERMVYSYRYGFSRVPRQMRQTTAVNIVFGKPGGMEEALSRPPLCRGGETHPGASNHPHDA